MAYAWKRSPRTSPVTATPRWSCSASTPTTSPSSTATFPDPPATRSPNASSLPAAACRSSCSPPPTDSTTKPQGSNSAPTTTSPSPSNSKSSCSVSEHSTAGAPTTGRQCERSPACGWTRSAARSTATAATSRSPASSSRCSKSSSPPKAASSARKSYWSGRGMRTQTRSPTPCASRSRRCANASASPGSSSRSPGPATASTLNHTAKVREASVDRAPGLSVRLKLTLSYAGFLMVAGAVLLAAVWVFLLRDLPEVWIIPDGRDVGWYRGARDFAPAAAAVLAFLLVFGLVGGWILAGRMLAPLSRITAATRTASTGSLSHRIELEGRKDEFRELADAFDAMLARLEARVAEQQRFAANASHELRTPLAISQTLLDVARKDQNRANGELVDRLHAVNTRAIDLTEALLLLSGADQRSFTREHVDLSLIAEEATETLLPLAEERGLILETSGDMTPTIGSHALLLQLSTNLVHNAVVHNLPEQGTVWVTTSVRPKGVVLTVENTGKKLTPQSVATLAEPFQRGTDRIRGDHAGVGLGLAIVQSIAEAHDGTLTLTPRAAGGLCVTVQLPARHRTLADDDQGNCRTPREDASQPTSRAGPRRLRAESRRDWERR